MGHKELIILEHVPNVFFIFFLQSKYSHIARVLTYLICDVEKKKFMSQEFCVLRNGLVHD